MSSASECGLRLFRTKLLCRGKPSFTAFEGPSKVNDALELLRSGKGRYRVVLIHDIDKPRTATASAGRENLRPCLAPHDSRVAGRLVQALGPPLTAPYCHFVDFTERSLLAYRRSCGWKRSPFSVFGLTHSQSVLWSLGRVISLACQFGIAKPGCARTTGTFWLSSKILHPVCCPRDVGLQPFFVAVSRDWNLNPFAQISGKRSR